MYKLTVRMHCVPMLIVAAICFGGIFICIKELASLKIEVVSFSIPLACLLVAAAVTFSAYKQAPGAQKIRAFATCLSFSVIYGCFANLFRGTILLDRMSVLIHAAPLIAMTIGAGASTLAFWKLTRDEPVERSAVRSASHATVEPSPDVTERSESRTKVTGNRMRGAANASGTKLPQQSEPLRPSPSPSSSATNLLGLLDNLSPDENIDTGEKLKAQPGAPQTGQKVGASLSKLTPQKASEPVVTPAKAVSEPPAETPVVAAQTVSPPEPHEPKKTTTTSSASSTATRLQAQKRKSTNTFIKLQALSASGTGSQQRSPRAESSGSEAEGDSLKSMLDRLDTRFEAANEDPIAMTEEVAMDSLFAQESLLTPHEVAKPDPPEAPKAVAAPAPEPVKQPVAAPVAPPVVRPPAPPTPTPSTPAAKTPSEPPSLSSMLDSLDSATSKPGASGLGSSKFGSLSSAARMPNPLSPNRGAQAAAPATPAPSTSSKPAAAAAPATPSPSTSSPVSPSPPATSNSAASSTNSGSSAPTTESSASPSQSVASQSSSSGSIPAAKKLEMPKSNVVSDATKSGANIKVAPSSGQPTQKPPSGAAPGATKPPFAVPSGAKPTGQTPPAGPAKPPVGAPGARPPEPSRPAQPAAGASRPEPPKPQTPKPPEVEVKPTPAAAPSASAEKVASPKAPTTDPSDNLLGSVDKEIDDIFSQLVPPDAQKEVAVHPDKPRSIPDAGTANAAPKPAATAPGSAKPTSSAPKPSSPPPAPTSAPKPQAPTAPAAGTAAKPQPGKPSAPTSPATAPKPAAAKSTAESKDGLFENGIDQEIDDIFSQLVPEEAQKEVHSSPSADEAESDTAPGVVQSEIPSDTVSELKGEEANEVSEIAEPKALTDGGEEEEGNNLFEESKVDQELDDIFSTIAPVEAQRPVTRETLSKLKAMDPVEPLAQPKKDEPISFAPPAESEAEDKQLSREEKLRQQLEKPGRFNETLASLPSMQGTIEGLLANLANADTVAETESTTESTESFAPPESTTESFSPPAVEPVANKVMNLLESLEATADQPVQEASPEEKEKAKEKERQNRNFSMPEEGTTTGDTVNDLFAASARDAESPSKSEAKNESESSSSASTEAQSEATAHSTETEAADDSSSHAEEEIAPTAHDVKTADEADEVEAAPDAKVADQEVPAAETVAEEPGEVEQTSGIAAEKTSDQVVEESTDDGETTRTKEQLKEFGRLSTKPGKAIAASESAGTMKTIGKLLIEVQAVENIIKAGEKGTIGSGLSTARVITAQRGEGINALLHKIDTYEGVIGSLIVGHDGLVIASTVKSDTPVEEDRLDKDTAGVLSVACVSTSNLGTKKLEIGKLRQMVLMTNRTLTVLTDVDVGILAVFLKDNDISRVDGVLNAIHDTIHG